MRSGLVHIRPPNGLISHAAIEHLRDEEHMQVILWSVHANDTIVTTPDRIVEGIMGVVKAGDIILCNDASHYILDYLPNLIDRLHSKYFELLTVAEMRGFPTDTPLTKSRSG